MPDDTMLCILGRLQAGQESLIRRIEEIHKDVKASDEKLAERVDEIEKRLSDRDAADAKRSGFVDGVSFSLAKFGAVCLLILSATGWFALHGIPEPIKSALNLPSGK